jgi:hypothetical protein
LAVLNYIFSLLPKSGSSKAAAQQCCGSRFECNPSEFRFGSGSEVLNGFISNKYAQKLKL